MARVIAGSTLASAATVSFSNAAWLRWNQPSSVATDDGEHQDHRHHRAPGAHPVAAGHTRPLPTLVNGEGGPLGGGRIEDLPVKAMG